ncbi:MAG TPA: hypothetical protein VFC78_09440 [Tepidisphaeraceae bacterium]|nr:hypothetical protein [Tepidisphaeraceae bacterium]
MLENLKTPSLCWADDPSERENTKSEARNPKQIQKQERRKIQKAFAGLVLKFSF